MSQIVSVLYNGSMQNHSGNSIKNFQIKKINTRDRYYSISPFPFNEEKLLNSIKIAGITVPVQLEAGPDKDIRIVSGFKRVLASAQAGMTEIPGIVAEKGDPLLTFWKVAQENYGARDLHDLEKAEIIRKLKELHSVAEQDLLSLYMPGIGLKGSRYKLDRFLKLAGLSDFLKESCINDILLCGTAIEIRSWPEPEQVFFAGLASRLKLGTNKQKQLLRLIEDLKKMERVGLDAVWKICGLQDSEPGDINFEKIYQLLTEKRFPVLSEHQKKWVTLREGLNLHQGIKLQIPRFFDGDSITVTFSAANPAEFRDKAEQLLEASRKKELDDIYSLL